MVKVISSKKAPHHLLNDKVLLNNKNYIKWGY